MATRCPDCHEWICYGSEYADRSLMTSCMTWFAKQALGKIKKIWSWPYPVKSAVDELSETIVDLDALDDQLTHGHGYAISNLSPNPCAEITLSGINVGEISDFQIGDLNEIRPSLPSNRLLPSFPAMTTHLAEDGSLIIFSNKGREVITVDIITGQVTLGEDSDLDRVSMDFWTNIHRLGGHNSYLDVLSKSVKEYQELTRTLTTELNQLKMVSSTSTDNEDRFTAIMEDL